MEAKKIKELQDRRRNLYYEANTLSTKAKGVGTAEAKDKIMDKWNNVVKEVKKIERDLKLADIEADEVKEESKKAPSKKK